MSGLQRRCLCGIGMFSFFVASSAVDATVFTDVGAFDAAAPGLPVLDFEGIAPAGGFAFMSDFSAQGMTFSDANGITNGVIVTNKTYPTVDTPSDFVQQMFIEQPLVMHFNPPVTAAGFNVSIPSVRTSVDNSTAGIATIEAFNGTTLLASVALMTTGMADFTTFAGFSGIGDITGIQITPESARFGQFGEEQFSVYMDNLAFGVPEPASLSLLAVGVVLSIRRRHHLYQSR